MGGEDAGGGGVYSRTAPVEWGSLSPVGRNSPGCFIRLAQMEGTQAAGRQSGYSHSAFFRRGLWVEVAARLFFKMGAQQEPLMSVFFLRVYTMTR